MKQSKSVILIATIIFISVPFIVAYAIWFYWMEPITYYQKVISVLGSFFTIVGTFYVETEIF